MNEPTEKQREMLRARSGGRCERCKVAPATDFAHRCTRSIRNHGVENAVHLCRPCHSWCHRNPTAATKAGWMLSRYVLHPEDVPLVHHGYVEYLDPYGGKREVRTDSPRPEEQGPSRSG